jgi:3' terminal RNA ribose 2'-O-methyltransferase Hen1
MLLAVTTTHRPATDLGFLLAEAPSRSRAFDLPFGRAAVYFPEATDDRCTAVLQVELAPAASGGRGEEDAPLSRYVDDRPWAASPLLSLAIARVFGSALAGRSRQRPALARSPLPLEATVVSVPCRGGETLVRRLFAPLGWEVSLAPVSVPESDGATATRRAFDLTLRGTCTLSDLLAQVCVLVPALDDPPRDPLGDDEADGLLALGGAWLRAHPERELVVGWYRGPHPSPVRDALARLTAGEAPPEPSTDEPCGAEVSFEAALRLAEAREEAVVRLLRERRVRSVADLGCGDGRLLRRLAEEPSLRRVVGVDVSERALARARRRLDPDRMPAKAARKVELLLGSVLYRDARLAGLEAAVLTEVIEHVDEERLPALVDAVFGAARPRLVVITTPNADHDARSTGLAPGAFRHPDHRFEWSRATFRTWAEATAREHGYQVRFDEVGPPDDERGAPTQLAEFER